MSTASRVKPIGNTDQDCISDGGSRATPPQAQNLTAADLAGPYRLAFRSDAAQWRSSAEQVDVRDQSWGMKAPERVCQPRPNLARRAV